MISSCLSDLTQYQLCYDAPAVQVMTEAALEGVFVTNHFKCALIASMDFLALVVTQR